MPSRQLAQSALAAVSPATAAGRRTGNRLQLIGAAPSEVCTRKSGGSELARVSQALCRQRQRTALWVERPSLLHVLGQL